MNIKRLIKISRPRFWIYVLGPFLVGVISTQSVFQWEMLDWLVLSVLFLFFTYPANILIYGVNDIYDYETDKHNPKKQEYEELIEPGEQQAKLWKSILMALIPFLVISVFLPWKAFAVLLVFLLASIFYSALPIRAKARPPLDIIFSSIIYITPGLIGYYAVVHTHPSWLAVLGGLLWAFAMQTYSAVPDIESDTKAGVATLATILGQKASLWFCFISYALAMLLGFMFISWLSLVLGILYLVMVGITLVYPQKIFNYYQWFPWLNTLSGFLVFWYFALKLL